MEQIMTMQDSGRAAQLSQAEAQLENYRHPVFNVFLSDVVRLTENYRALREERPPVGLDEVQSTLTEMKDNDVISYQTGSAMQEVLDMAVSKIAVA